MITIKNKETIIRNGETPLNRKARMLAIKSLEAALNAFDSKQIIKSKVLLKNSTLYVDGYTFDLRKFKNVYVIYVWFNNIIYFKYFLNLF